jgi:DNA-binding HxlR family transcriptional regulator
MFANTEHVRNRHTEVFDCDFNQMLRMQYRAEGKRSSSGTSLPGRWQPAKKTYRNHCLGCTAGHGSSCTGALESAARESNEQIGDSSTHPNPLIQIIAGLELISLQHVKVRAVVDVVCLPVEHQRGNRLHASGFRLGDPAFLFGEMHDFDFIFHRIHRIGDVLFRGDAHRAAGVIECGFVAHGLDFFRLFFGCPMTGCHRTIPPSRWRGTRKPGTFWFPLAALSLREQHQVMADLKKFLTLHERTAYHRLEDVIGCKWSTGVVAAIGEGVRRPGELERYIPGISKKILNERLRKLRDFGIIDRREFSGTVAHVEYHLTATGEKLRALLEQIRDLNQNHKP